MSSYLQDKMHKKMDADGDGGVSQSEFQSALEKVAGKLGVEVGQGASELYASLDANKDGALNGSEVGTLLQNLFSSASNTQAFVQSRGDEARFAELDADSDGQISMAEFGITPSTETTVVQTTTVITTTQELGSDGASALAGATGPTAPASTTPVHAVTTPEADPVVASTDEAAAETEDASLQALMQTVDTDGSGDISSAELNAYVAKLSAQAEAASKRYNDTALASLSGGSLNESA
jgi:Ca2+-binding EF-hand superfamily protein